VMNRVHLLDTRVIAMAESPWVRPVLARQSHFSSVGRNDGWSFFESPHGMS
jgi:hypothetical protein